MTQTAGRYPRLVDPALLFLRHRDPLAVAATVYYHGVVIALDSQGRAAKATGAANLKIVGWYDGETFTAEATDRVSVTTGVTPMLNSSTDPVTIADLKQVVYLESDDTIARTSAGGTLSPCGVLELYEDSTPKVQIGAIIPSVVAGGAGSLLLHAPVANGTAMEAIPATDRANGMLCLDLGQDLLWTFDSGSSAAADDWTREPDAGTGRWVRKNASLEDLATPTAGHGAFLVASADLGSFTVKTNTEEQVQEIYQHLLSAVGGYVTIPLSAWRVVSATGDVGDIAAIGGVLASDTAPIFEAVATSNEQAIRWVATGVEPIGVSIALPRDFDDTADATLDLEISSGATNAATMGCASAWSAGAAGTEVSDSTVDVASATPHRLSITIAAADIPAGARRATFRLTPPAHAADAISLHASGLAYKPKLLTA
jgi:hypothetical protein